MAVDFIIMSDLVARRQCWVFPCWKSSVSCCQYSVPVIHHSSWVDFSLVSATQAPSCRRSFSVSSVTHVSETSAITAFFWLYHFSRTMHYGAKRGLAVAFRIRSHVVRPSVCLSVCLSVTLVDQDHIDWKSWTISPPPSLFVAQRPKEHGKIMERLTLSMSFEYVEYCVFIGRRPCAPVVRVIKIGNCCVPSQCHWHGLLYFRADIQGNWLTDWLTRLLTCNRRTCENAKQ